MMTEYDNDLLREGILHFKSKEYALARRYFERALDAADDLQTRAQANYYLSLVTDDPRKKRQFLKKRLRIDMGHAEARRSLAILDGKLNPAEIINPDPSRLLFRVHNSPESPVHLPQLRGAHGLFTGWRCPGLRSL